jgi:hypothetical protein
VIWRRRLLVAAAVLAVPVALALAVLAVDVLRTPSTLADDDVRFEAAPRRSAGLWEGLDFLPGRPAEHALDLGDDLDYRRTMAAFLRVEPGRVEIFGPELENLLGTVQREVTEGSAGDANPARRSRYLNLLAVMALQRYGSDAAETETILRSAVNTLRSAVETDPTFADAKLNLELALRSAKATNVPGIDPSGGAAEGTISGQGRSGSGY